MPPHLRDPWFWLALVLFVYAARLEARCHAAKRAMREAVDAAARLRAWINYQCRPLAGGPFRDARPAVIRPLPDRHDDMGTCRRCGAHQLQNCNCTDEQWYADLQEKRQ